MNKKCKCGAALEKWQRVCYRCSFAKIVFSRLISGQQYCGGKVGCAVASGKLRPARELRCVDCDSNAEHYDHRDYNKPLEVSPVCRRCNFRRGKAIPKNWERSELLIHLRRHCADSLIRPWLCEAGIKFVENNIHRFCDGVELATSGAVTRYDLRPDIFGAPPKRAAA